MLLLMKMIIICSADDDGTNNKNANRYSSQSAGFKSYLNYKLVTAVRLLETIAMDMLNTQAYSKT